MNNEYVVHLTATEICALIEMCESSVDLHTESDPVIDKLLEKLNISSDQPKRR